MRELRQVIEAACARARHMVTVADVHGAVAQYERFAPAPHEAAVAPPHPADPADALFGGCSYDEVTRAYYHYLVRVTGGQMTEAARLADIGKTTIYEWRKRYAENDGAD